MPGPIGDIDLNGLYKGVIQLGNSGATGIAAYIDSPDFEPGPTTDGGTVPAVVADGSGSGFGGTPSTPASVSTSPDPSSDSGDGVAAPATPASPDQQLVGFVEELYGNRVRLVYLAFTLIALALCLAPRLALPARLPRSSCMTTETPRRRPRHGRRTATTAPCSGRR